MTTITDHLPYTNTLRKWIDDAEQQQERTDAMAAVARAMLAPALADGWTETRNPHRLEMKRGLLTMTLTARPCNAVQFDLMGWVSNKTLPLACGHGSNLALLMERAYAILAELGLREACYDVDR